MFYDFTKSFDENINSRNLVSENYNNTLSYKRKQNPSLYDKEVKRLTAFIFESLPGTIRVYNHYDVDNGEYLNFNVLVDAPLQTHIEIFELCDIDDVLNLSKKLSIDDKNILTYVQENNNATRI